MQQDLLLLSKNMKNIKYILLAVVLLSVSCEQEPPTVDFGKLPVHYGYMQFSTGVSNTRAHLAESMRGRDFGVIGFKFSNTSTWASIKSTNAPGDWFFNQKVTCGSDGVCTYTPIKQWENNNYAFFAYHPHDGAGITLSKSDKVNTPTLEYTYGWLNTTGNISLYDSNSPSFDLMTAEAIDVNGSGSGRVDLEFKHRLFAFEVLANNYNETTYKYQKDADGNFLLDNKGNKIFELDAEGKKIVDVSAAQKISGLTLTLEGLTNTKMVIPLSMGEGEADPVYTAGNVGTRTFKVSDDQLVIPAFNETIEHTFNGETEVCGAGVATSISKYGSTNGGYLFLIPQAGTNNGIKGTLNWNELEYFQGDKDEVQNEFSSTIDFVPGVLYQIHINFVGDGITIALIEAGTWDSSPEVEHKFE